MTLAPALRVAAALVFLAACLGALTGERLLLGPFAVAAVLLALSFPATQRPRPMAWLSIGLALAIPVGVLVGWLRGQLPGTAVIANALVFGWLLWTAARSLRRSPSPPPRDAR